MKRLHIVHISFVLVLVSLITFSVSSRAERTDIEKDIKAGISQFRHEDFDEALETFTNVRKADPSNSLAAYYAGLCHKQMEDYVAAKKDLEASLNMTPKIKGALIELIDVLYRLDEIEEAKKWIQVAEDEGVRPAQAAFLKGLTLLKSDDFEAAIESFKNAKDLDEALTASADYQIGLCYLRMHKLSDAKEIFSGLVDSEAGKDISSYAQRYLYEIGKQLERERPWNLALRFAFEYDTNVTLTPDNFEFATPISEQSDTREVYDVRTDYTFRNHDRTKSLMAAYQLRFSKQNDLGLYDYLTNSFSLEPKFAVGDALITFPVNYSHNVVNSKNYLSAVTVGNVNNIRITDSHMAKVGVLYNYDDYLRPPYGTESRTGNELTGLAGWYWFFPEKKGFANARYSFNKDWTHGTNWEFWGNRIDLGAWMPFWEKFETSLNSQFYFKNYSHTHTFFGKKRDDQSYSLSTSLAYELLKGTKLQFQYTFIHNASNLALYDYSRNVFSWGVQYQF